MTSYKVLVEDIGIYQIKYYEINFLSGYVEFSTLPPIVYTYYVVYNISIQFKSIMLYNIQPGINLIHKKDNRKNPKRYNKLNNLM